jgi:hypothetical protein
MDRVVATPPHSSTASGAQADVHWPTLLGRVLEDLSRVIQLEVRLLEAKIAPAVSATADRLLAGLVVLCAGAMAGACFLAAFVLLLHKWMPLWQCFAIGGVVAAACSAVALVWMKRPIISDQAKIG